LTTASYKANRSLVVSTSATSFGVSIFLRGVTYSPYEDTQIS
jgi:hypothetical protein